jgi:hypothetical protein
VTRRCRPLRTCARQSELRKRPTGGAIVFDSGTTDRGRGMELNLSSTVILEPRLTENLIFCPSHCSPSRLYAFQRVALSFCGYGDSSNWARAQDMLLNTPDRGRKWLQGGWKDEPSPVGAEWDVNVDTDSDVNASEAGSRGSKEENKNEVYRRGREEGARLKAGLDGLREVVGSVRKV